MTHHCAGVMRIVERVNGLREPFRQNAIDWLCVRTRRSLVDLPLDLDQFLNEQDFFVQEFFIKNTLAVLDAAVTHFGDRDKISVSDFRRRFSSEISPRPAAARFDAP